jgi:hypothetical protein
MQDEVVRVEMSEEGLEDLLNLIENYSLLMMIMEVEKRLVSGFHKVISLNLH